MPPPATATPTVTGTRASEALGLLVQYSVEITRIAAATLGDPLADNRHIEILSLLRVGPLSPGELQARTGLTPSAVSRILRTQEDEGLIMRTRSPRDGRSRQATLTTKGRRRIRDFQDRLTDYFRSAGPAMRSMLALLDAPGLEHPVHDTVDVLAIVTGMAHAGARYVEDVTAATRPYGLVDDAARYILCLVDLRGSIRPSQIASELQMTATRVSATLDRLDRAGLIRRRHDTMENDRRAVVVQATATGRRAARDIYAVFDRSSYSD